MKLSELIDHVGDEHIQTQSLRESVKRVDAKKDGKAALITFYTSPELAMDLVRGDGGYVGLVIWLPRERIPDELTAVPQDE